MLPMPTCWPLIYVAYGTRSHRIYLHSHFHLRPPLVGWQVPRDDDGFERGQVRVGCFNRFIAVAQPAGIRITTAGKASAAVAVVG